MKKIIALCSMIVALGFVAAGCGGGSSPAPVAPAPVVDTDATYDETDAGEAGDEEADE